MTLLRQHIQGAREEYLLARYPGDLRDILPSRQAQPGLRWDLRQAGWGLGLAAAAAVVLIAGLSPRMAGKSLDVKHVQAMLPSMRDLPLVPGKREMAGAVKTITPPEVPELLLDVQKPLESSGKFIVNIGKDIAHHADALFHMG